MIATLFKLSQIGDGVDTKVCVFQIYLQDRHSLAFYVSDTSNIG